MAGLKTPIISVVIGEGGSGGALAIGVGDRLLMLQYSIYSVISPEGCASILWKSADKAEDAAEAMRITAQSLSDFDLVDEVLAEGARRARAAGESDLLAELILCSHMLQLPLSGELAVGRDELVRRQRADGSWGKQRTFRSNRTRHAVQTATAALAVYRNTLPSE